MLLVWVVEETQQGQLQTADEVPVVLAQRRQVVGVLEPPVGDVGALGVDAGDLVAPALPVGLQRHRQCQVPAAGLPRHDQVADAELVFVRRRPPDGRRAIAQPGGERVRAECAAGIAELDADDDEPCRRQVLAEPDVLDVRGAEDGHPTAVQVHHSGQRTGGLRGPADVERDLVAVGAGDGGGRAADALGRGGLLPQHLQDGAGPLFGEVGELHELLERGVERQGRFRQSAVHPERGESFDHARISARVGADGAVRVSEASKGHGPILVRKVNLVAIL